MTLCPCQKPLRKGSKLGLCEACTQSHHARVARERQAEYHRQEMLKKYGRTSAPKDWRKDAIKKSEPIIRPRMPAKFIGVPVVHAPEIIDPGVPITRYPLSEFKRIDAAEFDPAKARFIDGLLKATPDPL